MRASEKDLPVPELMLHLSDETKNLRLSLRLAKKL